MLKRRHNLSKWSRGQGFNSWYSHLSKKLDSSMIPSLQTPPPVMAGQQPFFMNRTPACLHHFVYECTKYECSTTIRISVYSHASSTAFSSSPCPSLHLWKLCYHLHLCPKDPCLSYHLKKLLLSFQMNQGQRDRSLMMILCLCQRSVLTQHPRMHFFVFCLPITRNRTSNSKAFECQENL